MYHPKVYVSHDIILCRKVAPVRSKNLHEQTCIRRQCDKSFLIPGLERYMSLGGPICPRLHLGAENTFLLVSIHFAFPGWQYSIGAGILVWAIVPLSRAKHPAKWGGVEMVIPTRGKYLRLENSVRNVCRSVAKTFDRYDRSWKDVHFSKF